MRPPRHHTLLCCSASSASAPTACRFKPHGGVLSADAVRSWQARRASRKPVASPACIDHMAGPGVQSTSQDNHHGRKWKRQVERARVVHVLDGAAAGAAGRAQLLI